MRRVARLIPVLAMVFAPLVRGGSIYVSPSGNDANDGAGPDRAVRTLQRAQELERAANGALTDDLTIWLAGGVYRLTEPLVLDARDSGSGGHDIVWAALPGQRPVISGGVAVTGWHEVDRSRNLWAAAAPAGLENTRQLYVDGVRADRTSGRLPVALRETPDGYETDGPAMAHWRNPSDIEFVYTGGNALWSEGSYGLGAWTEPRIPVAAIHGRSIVMAQPAWNNSTRRVMLENRRFHRTANLVGPASVGKRPSYVENAYELLGPPGHWYLDRPSRTFYYVPRPGEDLAQADVEAPVLQALVVSRGTPDHPVHDIAFRGLQFSYATWLFPSGPEGFSEIQANYLVTGRDGYRSQGLDSLYPGGTRPYADWTRIPGNVSFAASRHIEFTRDVFAHLGAAGLELGDGSQGDAVVGCIFTDISGNGVELGGVDQPLPPASAMTRDNRIADNHICDVGAEYHGGIGVVVGYAQRTLIEHNQIDHVPYSGISIDWGGWPDKIGQPGLANCSADNVVAHNLIFEHMLVLADGSSIYTNGLTGPDMEHGEKVLANVVHDQFGSGHGIYSDNGSCYMTIAENVIFDMNFDNWGSAHRDYYPGATTRFDPIVVRDNYWEQGDFDHSANGITETGNRLISAMDQAPSAIRNEAGLEPAYRDLLDEALVQPAPPEAPDHVAAWVGDRVALVAWDPPRFDGGSRILSYTVSASTGRTVTVSAEDYRTMGYVRIAGMPDGVPCTFTVTATNCTGSSVPSMPSEAVRGDASRVSPPAAPARAWVDLANGIASVHFRAPPSVGGAPVIAIEVTVNPGARKILFTGRKVLVLSGAHMTFDVIDGLSESRDYTFDVAAVNVAGAGPAVRAEVRRADVGDR